MSTSVQPHRFPLASRVCVTRRDLRGVLVETFEATVIGHVESHGAQVAYRVRGERVAFVLETELEGRVVA